MSCWGIGEAGAVSGSGPDNLWLIQPLREKVVCTIIEALLLLSTAFLVSFSTESLAVAQESPAPEGMLLHLTFRGPPHRVLAKNPIAIGGCLSLHWQVWSDEGAEPWVVEVLQWGIPDSLPLDSHLIQGSHPFTGVCLQFHQGQSSGGRGSGSAEQGCLRAGSASISRLLQPVIHGYESFRGVETGHRPFHSDLEDSADILQDGDTSIRSSLGLSGGLDGVSGLEGCVLAGAIAPGFTQVPQVRGGGEGVPVQGTLLRPFHGSACFYQGHGSCVSNSTQDEGTTLSLPDRLVASGILTRAGSPCSEDSAPTLQAPRDCCHLGEVSGDSDSADGISGSHPGLTAFRASPSLKRVEKLLSIGDVFLSCVSQPVSSGLELLGVLSSMFQLVPGGRLRSSLQACGLRKTSSARSMPGSSWRSRVLLGGLLHFSPVPQWRS